MRPRTRFPGKVEDVQLQFFGRFTWKDIARITAPALLLYIPTTGLLSPIIGLLLGAVLYSFRPYNRSLDQHLYHLVRFHLGRLL
jgi:hypothetical protein